MSTAQLLSTQVTLDALDALARGDERAAAALLETLPPKVHFF